MKTKKAFLSDESYISFPNSKIQFNSININEDVVDVYILYNGKKLESLDSESPNFYRINPKDIGICDNFKEINFTVVNNIELFFSFFSFFILKFSKSRKYLIVSLSQS